MGLETSTLIAIGTVASAAGAAYSGYVANDNAIDAGKAADERAAQTRAAAQEEAANIREKGKRLAATQAATLASSGVKLTADGTVDTILTETANLAEKDALTALRNGNATASAIKKQGDITKGYGLSNAVSSGLNFASSSISKYSGYKAATSKSETAKTMNIRTTNKYGLSLMGGDT